MARESARAAGAGLLPRSLAYLGELGPCVLHWQGRFYDLPYKPGRILCAHVDGDGIGREMFVLRPRVGREPIKPTDQTTAAAGLHERFTHRRADKLFNCYTPAFRTPEFRGELVIIRYTAAKADLGLVEWEHYFENPGIAPAYAQLWDVGHGQFYIPRGPWRAAEPGIEYARPMRRGT